MKRLFFYLLLVFTTVSCSLNDDENRYHLEVLPVEAFEIPESFVQGSTHPVKLFYKRPTTCYGYDGIYYDRYENIRTIGVQVFVLEQSNCTPIDEEAPLSEASFNFHVTQPSGTNYIFKFYKGKNTEGNNVFEEVEIPVIE